MADTLQHPRPVVTSVARTAARLGSEHVLVVHAQDGLDEISLAAPTYVAELFEGSVREYQIQPEDFGIKSQSLIGLTVAVLAVMFGVDAAAAMFTDSPLVSAGVTDGAADVAVTLARSGRLTVAAALGVELAAATLAVSLRT